jgi:hypothetical protein
LNTQNIALADTIFEELVSEESFIETCDFLRLNLIRLDQHYKGKISRQIHNDSKSSNRAKNDKAKMVLVLINEIQIQIQDSCISDEEPATVPLTKTAMVCTL